MRELNRPTPSPSESSEKRIDHLFESRERVRMNSALTELRDHCKTTEALRTFDKFEDSLLKKLGISRQSLQRAGALAHGKGAEEGLTASRTMPTNMSNTLGTHPLPMSRVSTVDTEAVLSGACKTLYGEANMAKSKTTGDMASLIPTIPKRQHFLMPSPKPTISQQGSHQRKTSYLECSPKTRAKAMKEHQLAACRAAEVHHRATSHAFSPDGSQIQQAHEKTTSTIESARPQPLSYDSKVGEYDEVSFSSSAAALESGHGRPPPASAMTAPSRVELVSVSSGGKEKVIKSRLKPERQSSGDRVKNLLGAGVREVKKMGRRVSGMSWPGSGEE